MEIGRWLRWRASIFLFITGVLKRMTFGVRGALVDGDKVLLIKHTYLPGWHLPGGGVDHGEGAEEAMAREVFEETGYRLTGAAELFGIYLNTLPPRRDYVALYVCRDFEKAQDFVPNREIADLGWFPHNALPGDVSKATRTRVAEIFDGAPRSPAWKD